MVGKKRKPVKYQRISIYTGSYLSSAEEEVLRAEVQGAAAQQGMSMSQLCLRYIQDGLRRHREGEQ